MAARFTDAPSLPKANDKARIDPQIRITPSVLGDRPLSDKAIPYYYRQNGTPPLYRLWSGEKTRRNRANQNLSYRYDEYNPRGTGVRQRAAALRPRTVQLSARSKVIWARAISMC